MILLPDEDGLPVNAQVRAVIGEALRESVADAVPSPGFAARLAAALDAERPGSRTGGSAQRGRATPAAHAGTAAGPGALSLPGAAAAGAPVAAESAKAGEAGEAGEAGAAGQAGEGGEGGAAGAGGKGPEVAEVAS